MRIGKKPESITTFLGPDAHIEGKIVTLSVDGQVSQQFSKNEEVEIVIHKAKHKIKWIRHKNRTFYDLLRTKLNWGVDKRTF